MMPFIGEFAPGDSLLNLQNSTAVREFAGRIRHIEPGERLAPTIVRPHRRDHIPQKIVAIDGSIVNEVVQNGFPGADASITNVSVVFIDLGVLLRGTPMGIPDPRAFREMEEAVTLDGVLPGANIVRNETDSPLRFFRDSVHEIMLGRLDAHHETLIETMRAIVRGRHDTTKVRCPIEDCDRYMVAGEGRYPCECGRAQLLETDPFRFFEHFRESGSNGEAHGEVLRTVEFLVLFNLLRYFAQEGRWDYLRDNAFVLDGPLAMFGTSAWLTPYFKEELRRIDAECRDRTGEGLLLFGLEKSGQFMNHFEAIDFDPEEGPRGRYSAQTVIIPSRRYTNRHIVYRSVDAKPHGQDTYMGRKVLYKTRSNQHTVLNYAMVNARTADFDDVSPDAFPRLGDVLDIMDHLHTYLYQDGFMPLVRAHAHAAIPLKVGGDIIRDIFRRP